MMVKDAVKVGQPPTLSRSVYEATGVDVARCYQCGKCTAGCPMTKYMDLMPHQIMRLVQIGGAPAEEKVLGCAALWSCAGCLTCTQRCPKELDPAAVMDALREMAHDRDVASPKQKKVLAFHEAFLKTVESSGRLSELALVRRYKMASLDFMSDVNLVPAMLARGKLKFGSHKTAGRREVQKIFAACRPFDHAQGDPECHRTGRKRGER
jgi:heterodisulfide reductase subunit C